MKKYLSMLLLSTVVLSVATPSVLAEEATVTTTSEVVAPTEPTAPVATPSTPTEEEETNPISPVDPTAPSTSEEEKKEETTPPSTTSPSTGESTEPSTPPAIPTPEKEVEEVETKPKTTEEANQEGTSQVGTVSTSTGQVVHNPIVEPVTTDTGFQIVSTEAGRVVLQDGRTLAPEEIGAVTNPDKTISIKKEDGKMTTLPHTGESGSVLAFLGGVLLSGLGIVGSRKRKEN